MLFDGLRTASLTMTAFNQGGGRKTRIFGTRGEIECDGDRIRIFDFLTDQWEEIEINLADHSAAGGHGGGDYGLMTAFTAAVGNDDPSQILSGPDETLESHLMVFGAEQARRENRVIHFFSQKP
jgi:hypothetical protein